jgi:hypothetical protein
LLTAPLNDTMSRLKSYSTLGLEARPRRGDGVTLYFPNYPIDASATAEFNTFFKELREDLDRNELGLNVLVSQNVFSAGKNGGPGAFGAANLINLRKKRAATEPNRPGGPENDEFILVLLNEPARTPRSSCAMISKTTPACMVPTARISCAASCRCCISITATGSSYRMTSFMRAIPSADWVCGRRTSTTWPPVEDVTLSCLKSASLTTCLSRNYLDPGEDIKLPGPLEAFACVQRWLLRLILSFLLLVIVTVVVLFFRFCGAQNFIKKNFLYILLLVNIPATLVFILLLLYDPLLGRLSAGNLPFIITAAVGMAILIAGYMYLRKRRRVPMRQRSGLVRHEMGFLIVCGGPRPTNRASSGS